MALLVWLASVLLLVTVPLLFLIPYALSKGVTLQDSEAFQSFLLNDPTSLLLQIALVIPIHAITLAISWAVVTNFKKFSFREILGWEWGGFKIWHTVAIIAFFFLLAAGLTSIFGEQENELVRILKSSRTAVYLIAFMATFTAPIVEEVVYRGILYPAFKRKFGVAVSVIVVTALFAGVHFFQYWEDMTALILVSLLSLTLTLIRVKTGNLLPCIILHTVFNGIQSIMLILEPYLREQPNQATQQAAAFLELFK
jgi:membrane protease YdiL (CAAX protease family)